MAQQQEERPPYRETPGSYQKKRLKLLTSWQEPEVPRLGQAREAALVAHGAIAKLLKAARVAAGKAEGDRKKLDKELSAVIDTLPKELSGYEVHVGKWGVRVLIVRPQELAVVDHLATYTYLVDQLGEDAFDIIKSISFNLLDAKGPHVSRGFLLGVPGLRGSRLQFSKRQLFSALRLVLDKDKYFAAVDAGRLQPCPMGCIEMRPLSVRLGIEML